MGSPTISSIFVQRVIIGVGDLAVSNNPQVILSTYALGSCIGVVAFDPVTHVGGILHLMLPDSKISPAKAAANPAMFADTGLPQFFGEFGNFNASQARLRLFLAGGASIIGGDDPFKIGERNRTAVLGYLQQGGFQIVAKELGGSVNRTLHLDLTKGNLTLKTPTAQSQIMLGT